MVSSQANKSIEVARPISSPELPEDELRWCTVNLQEVFSRGGRLEASVFDIDGRHAREVLKRCKWPKMQLCGSNSFATGFYPSRFKRITVEKSDYAFILPSQIQEIDPKPKTYLSPLCKTNFESLKAKEGQILLTRSGTIGKYTLVTRTLDGKTLSDDIIRITSKEASDTGYLYAFLRTKIGQALMRTNEYGAVVSHIEPEHLENIAVPNPPPILKKRIHNLVIKSYDLRDESNDLVAEAEALLYDSLNLAPIEKLKPRYLTPAVDLQNYTVMLSCLDGRIDASYHGPIVNVILRKLQKEAAEITTIDDPRISKRISLPGRFSRVFVGQGQGAVYFTGKHIYDLDPSDKKYLAFSQHAQKIKEELTIRHNTLLVTCSGTLGKVVLCPRHWDGWVMTHDIIRVVPANIDIIGFVWAFLASDYGQELIKRYSYGAVVPHIEDYHIAQVTVPLLKDGEIQSRINRLILEANVKRSEAYYAEQEAVHITNEEVIHAAA